MSKISQATLLDLLVDNINLEYLEIENSIYNNFYSNNKFRETLKLVLFESGGW